MFGNFVPHLFPSPITIVKNGNLPNLVLLQKKIVMPQRAFAIAKCII